jgi:uncharacterized protein YigE (DUF2233 family)
MLVGTLAAALGPALALVVASAKAPATPAPAPAAAVLRPGPGAGKTPPAPPSPPAAAARPTPPAGAGPHVPPQAPWQALEPGLDVLELDGPAIEGAEGRITVVRVDPARFDLRLLASSAPGEGDRRSARAWAYRSGASAVINAAMYQEDYRTSVSLMRTGDHVNQRRLSKDKAVLAFDPIVSGVPAVKLVDRDCERLEDAAARYGTLIQSIRMVSCDGKNVWAPSDRRFSAAAIGLDRSGRVLFIHARTPWPIHDLVEALLAAPLELAQAMYVEGGPEAQLFARGGGRELERIGTFEGADTNARAWPVPNVVAAVRKPPAK